MKVYIAETPERGRGVFASSHLIKDELVESARVLVIPSEEKHIIMKTVLSSYLFHEWGEDGTELALALGIGSLFNHSYNPNTVFAYNLTEQTIEFRLLKDVNGCEELLVNYNGDPNDSTPVWFDVK